MVTFAANLSYIRAPGAGFAARFALDECAMQPQRLSPEMRLVLACCRWPRAGARPAVVAAAAEVEWDRVLVLARRHRVQAMVHHALHDAGVVVPEAAGEALRADARHIAVSNLRLAAESGRLVRCMDAAGVPVMVVKGSALAMRAYDTLAIKMAWDIDLLVPADGVEIAADVLLDAGYACTLPGPDRAELAAWHRYSKESVWHHPGYGVHVELHGALVDNPLVLPGISARSRAQLVEVAPGITLPTLHDDALFAYLCVHGAASGWRRAKWLADVAALLAGADAAEIARLHRSATASNAGRAASVALLLCERYLALPLPDALRASMQADPVVRLLVRLAARLMTAPGGFDRPDETRLGTLPIHVMQMLILPGWRFPLAELRRKLAPDPRHSAGSPRAWSAVRPVSAALRRVVRKPAPATRSATKRRLD